MTETNDASTRVTSLNAYFIGVIGFTWLFRVSNALQAATEEVL